MSARTREGGTRPKGLEADVEFSDPGTANPFGAIETGGDGAATPEELDREDQNGLESPPFDMADDYSAASEYVGVTQSDFT
jgi:hypothetical protein